MKAYLIVVNPSQTIVDGSQHRLGVTPIDAHQNNVSSRLFGMMSVNSGKQRMYLTVDARRGSRRRFPIFVYTADRLS